MGKGVLYGPISVTNILHATLLVFLIKGYKKLTSGEE